MRLIDADALKKEMLETYEYEYPTASGAFDEFASRIVPNIISNAPTIDAEPVRHGRWIKSDFLHIGANQYRCSECWEDKWWLYHFSLGDSNYCPNCGAKMLGGSDEE